jgi:DNA processing protein
LPGDDERRYWIGFHKIKGIGSARLGVLIERFGSAQAAWNASERELSNSGLSSDLVGLISTERRRIDPAHELERLQQASIRAITLEDTDYPRLLRQINAPPPVLYVKGGLIPADDLAIGVVGTRRATSYGLDMAKRVSFELAEAGVTVVSGLAAGIDSVAHRAALDAGGRTIAVFGCGLDTIYPPRNRRLADEICEAGALVGEYPLGTTPAAQNFPVRNRIISGLSRGVVVVEAPLKSGALITSTFAADQGRDVYAVPGSALSNASAGCHALIRDGATLVTSAGQILEQLNVEQAIAHSQSRIALPDSDSERILYELIGAEPRHMDELCHQSGLPIHTTSGALLAMELKGLVRQAGAQYYVRS